MAINSYYFNAIMSSDGTYDRTYTAKDFTNYLNLLVGNGVFPNPSTQLQVEASTGMNVVVNAGSGWINGHKVENTADLILSVDASDVVLSRIDRVVLYLDNTAREMGIKVLKGTAATTPVAPTLTRTEDRYELCLAEITVNKQVTSITGTDIKDTRLDSSVCGIVAGLIQQVDTTTLYNQYDSSFNEWFSDVKTELATATLIRQYTSSYTSVADDTIIPINISVYNQNLDVLNVYTNGMKLIKNVDYVINSNDSITLTGVLLTGNTIEFEVLKSIDGSDAESIVDLVYQLQTELAAKTIKKGVITLPASGWVITNTGTYTQTVDVSFISSVDEVILVSPVENINVRAIEQAVGSLTFEAYESITSDISVNVANLGV